MIKTIQKGLRMKENLIALVIVFLALLGILFGSQPLRISGAGFILLIIIGIIEKDSKFPSSSQVELLTIVAGLAGIGGLMYAAFTFV